VAALRARPDALEPDTIHRTRIAFKKFRYLVEILRPMLNDLGEEHLRRLRLFQTLMGEIQDIEMFEKAITGFIRDDPGRIKQFRQIRAELKKRHSELISHYAEATENLLSPLHPGNRGKKARVALN
jgi:CHAD domain-containing protein